MRGRKKNRNTSRSIRLLSSQMMWSDPAGYTWNYNIAPITAMHLERADQMLGDNYDRMLTDDYNQLVGDYVDGYNTSPYYDPFGSFDTNQLRAPKFFTAYHPVPSASDDAFAQIYKETKEQLLADMERTLNQQCIGDLSQFSMGSVNVSESAFANRMTLERLRK